MQCRFQQRLCLDNDAMPPPTTMDLDNNVTPLLGRDLDNNVTPPLTMQPQQ